MDVVADAACMIEAGAEVLKNGNMRWLRAIPVVLAVLRPASGSWRSLETSIVDSAHRRRPCQGTRPPMGCRDPCRLRAEVVAAATCPRMPFDQRRLPPCQRLPFGVSFRLASSSWVCWRWKLPLLLELAA